MKVKTRAIPVYVAYDGKEFYTVEECVKHEMSTLGGARRAMADLGRERQLCKNECRSAERAIVLWRKKAFDLLGHRKATRGCEVTGDIGKAFGVLAAALRKRGECRAKLRNLHERQGQLRELLDKNNGRNQ